MTWDGNINNAILKSIFHVYSHYNHFKRHFFGYILYLFKKKWGKMVSVLQYILFYILLTQLLQKINKKFSFTWLWGNIRSSNMVHQFWYIRFLFANFAEDWNLLHFLLYVKPRKEVLFVKKWLLLKVWTSSKLSGLILLTNIKRLYNGLLKVRIC